MTKPRSYRIGARARAFISAAAPTSATTRPTGSFRSVKNKLGAGRARHCKASGFALYKWGHQQEGAHGKNWQESRGRIGSPGSTFGRFGGDYRQRPAAAQPGGFEGLGSYSQE